MFDEGCIAVVFRFSIDSRVSIEHLYVKLVTHNCFVVAVAIFFIIFWKKLTLEKSLSRPPKIFSYIACDSKVLFDSYRRQTGNP